MWDWLTSWLEYLWIPLDWVASTVGTLYAIVVELISFSTWLGYAVTAVTYLLDLVTPAALDRTVPTELLREIFLVAWYVGDLFGVPLAVVDVVIGVCLLYFVIWGLIYAWKTLLSLIPLA